MDIHGKPIEERIDWLFGLADRHSAIFRSPEAWLARERYLAEHPTAIAVLKCMDGRINIPVATNTPVGILMPFRNLGGIFDLGWPHLGEVLAHHVQRVVSAGRHVVFLVTYHYSQGDPRRGCAGFQYDTEAAIAHTYEDPPPGRAHFRQRSRHRLSAGLRFRDRRGRAGHPRHGRRHARPGDADLDRPGDARTSPRRPAAGHAGAHARRPAAAALRQPGEHIEDVRAQIRRNERLLDIEHREWMICLGRGFDFLHTPNIALIIGPYSPNLDVPIRRAAGIIEANMQAGRIPTTASCSSPRYPTTKSASTAPAPNSSRASCRPSPPTSFAPSFRALASRWPSARQYSTGARAPSRPSPSGSEESAHRRRQHRPAVTTVATPTVGPGTSC
jgi:hypothetical protein